MLSRYILLRSCVVKTLIDMSKASAVSDTDFGLCKDICNSLEPVKLTSDSICRNDANLVTADAAIVFLLDTLDEEAGANVYARQMHTAVKDRISARRHPVMVNLLKYLVDADAQKPDAITGGKITKSSMYAKANNIFARLYTPLALPDDDVIPVDDQPGSSVNEEGPTASIVTVTLVEKLQKAIADSTKQPSLTQPLPTSLTLTQDIKMFEATRKRTEHLEMLFQCLMSVKPTSVESERTFSTGGGFCTKVRSRMSDATLSALVFLKKYFEK